MSVPLNTAGAPSINAVFLTASDLSAAIVGVIFQMSGQTQGSIGMAFVRSLVISVVARLMSQSSMVGNTMVTESNKNELVVAVLSGIASYMRTSNGKALFGGVISGISIDLMGVEVLRQLALPDTNLLGGGASV